MIAPKTGGREHVFFMKYTWHSKSAPRHIQQASGGILTPFLERFYERLRDAFISREQPSPTAAPPYSTVTDFAKFLGLSISAPLTHAA